MRKKHRGMKSVLIDLCHDETTGFKAPNLTQLARDQNLKM